jgi:hypothetical protein
MIDGAKLTDSNRVEEQGPGVADNPAVHGDAPGSGDHKETNEHNGCILNKAPAPADPAFSWS